MSEPQATNIIDTDNPLANVYGCLDCSQCGSKTRWPTGCRHKTHPECIICDGCGHVEKIEQTSKPVWG